MLQKGDRDVMVWVVAAWACLESCHWQDKPPEEAQERQRIPFSRIRANGMR
jgi:hypothetical protein